MFNAPQRLVWYEGALYISDSYNHAIRKMDLASGEISTVAGTGLGGDSGDEGPAINAQLYSPSGIAVRESGLYIADTGNNRLRWVDPDGIIHPLAGTGVAGFTGDEGPALEATYSWPIDLAVDDQGNVFVADMRNGAVRMVRSP
jgi:sugar lactone lactonase YvrE